MTTEIDRSAQMIYAKRVAREEGLAEGRAEGRAKGRAEGRAEGIEQTKLETARNLKTAGIAAEIISQCTGLTLEQVAEL